MPQVPLPPQLSLPNHLSLTPIGSVITYAGNIANAAEPGEQSTPLEPMGWMHCDGRALSVAQYPQLFLVLGYKFGQGTSRGAGTFNIPKIDHLNVGGVVLYYIIRFT